MQSTGRATIALSRFDSLALRTDHYASLEDMLAHLLMNSGEKIPFLVRDKLLPPAIAAWEKTIKQDNCEHDFYRGVCKYCEYRLDE